MAAVASRRSSSEGRTGLLGDGAPFAGKYAVERILGQGGMGTVFEARHLRLGHRVAIKVLGSELRDYPELVTRFEREARAAGALSSRHAVRVFDIDMTEDATPFIVMELLDGCDLARIVERDGPQPVGRAARWIIEACDAIAEAHRLGIVHRDLKPSNLFLTDAGVKVLDFGIAKRVASKEASITHAVAPLGTPQYMSPEQVRCAKDVDGRTDVWSLGVTLFELLTGRTPFAHENSSACIASIAADPVPDPRTFREDLPPELALVILRALRKDPTERYASIAELVEALAPFAEIGAGGAAKASIRDLVASSTKSLSEESTLDDSDSDAFLLASGVRKAPVDQTIPPAVSRAPARHDPSAKNGRRWRSSLALAAAAALGLGALVMTPKCVGEHESSAAFIERANTPPSHESRETAAPPAAETHANAIPPTPATAEEPTAEAEEPSATSEPPRRPAPRAAPAKKSRAAATAKPASSERPARLYAGDSPVHGGLSNPGF